VPIGLHASGQWSPGDTLLTVGSNEPPTLQGRQVTLRPYRPDDLDRLASILDEPSVARWWGPPPPGGAGAAWVEDGGQVTFVIDHEGSVVGSIQYHEELDADYRSAAVDLFLTTAAQGRGFGSDAIRTVARYLFDERGHHRLSIDPSAANERAIRAYERVGFRRVGVMRSYERGPDGTWHDGLMMDMLAADLG
jgi:aminoglycoside 6'-N-acetyltransferase